MALPFHPRPGLVVVCDYAMGGFIAPEMVKRRLAVVISPKLKRRDDLATVVPLSMDMPEPMCGWHLPLLLNVPEPWGEVPRWAKCDMVNTVTYKRLNLPHHYHPVTGMKQRTQLELDAQTVAALRACVSRALGMSH